MCAVKNYDIVIAGAGLVGASMACALSSDPATSSLSIALIDPGQPPQEFSGEEFDPRVVALTHSSQRFFGKMDVWGKVKEKRVTAYRKMSVWDGEGTAEIDFDCEEFGQNNLGYIVENSVALNAILNRINNFSNIDFFRGQQVESVSAQCSELNSSTTKMQLTTIALTNNTRIEAPLLVAADGAQSAIRKMLSMPTREWDYGHDAIVTTVRTEKPHQHTAWQRFINTGPLAFLPLTTSEDDDHFCSIVWSLSKECVPALMEKSDEDFAQALTNAFESKLGKIESVAKRFSFPLRQRHAIDYVLPGVALVGDAAHTIHPLAGQGVNLGLLDVQALVAEITRAQQRDIPLSDFSVLRRYQRQRKPDNLGMMAVMEGFKRLFGSTHPALHILRNIGMSRLNSLPLLKNAIAKRAMGL